VTSVQVEWPNAATAVLRLSRPGRLNALTHDVPEPARQGTAPTAAPGFPGVVPGTWQSHILVI